MKKQYKKIWASVVVIMVIGCFSVSMAYARLWVNYRDCVITPCITSTGDSSTSPLNTSLVESAGSFLKSHSNFQDFLNRVEMSEISSVDYNEFRETLYDAIENLERAKTAYANFKAEADKATYNRAMIDKLAAFNYDAFREKYGLNAPVFEKVKNFLFKADFQGLDTETLSYMEIILRPLYEVKSLVDREQAPDISLLWRINQSYAEAHLFGQYVSEVLKANI